MKLLGYAACGGTPFRILRVQDYGKLTDGTHERLDLFGCIFTNVDVSHDIDTNLAYLSLPTANDWRVNLTNPMFTKEYMDWFNGYSPTLEVMLDAHKLKALLPNITQEFDQFVDWLKVQIAKMPTLEVSFKNDTLTAVATGNKYDIWMLYKHYLMVDGNLIVTRNPEGDVIFHDAHISEKGTKHWLLEHNKEMMRLAAENDLLAAYITFGAVRGHPQYQYTFVTREGDYMHRPVDEAEFTHIAIRGQMPVVLFKDEGANLNLTVNIDQHFPQKYLDFTRTAHPVIGYNHALNLIRFI
ncbi:hypothetical protein pEaSNUABM23_00048 [Erwinia phage pEa_SNUABM_23]|nr:hypothetical protein pEaSNUABM23_00048 [Erwinia phage pEa_SNUABM_23]UIW10726.1 hypothetical protein pEaSNUABM23_00048 [Erwinia phage pEa_SNUABM_31]